MKKLFFLLASFQLLAAPTVIDTIHSGTGQTFKSKVIYQPTGPAKRPALLMVPNWMGVNDAAVEKALLLAQNDYVVFLVDMYGQEIRPSNAKEAGAAAGVVRADRVLMRKRINEAITHFKDLKEIPWDGQNMVGIGFCFGGGVMLELARSGTQINGVVSLHGDIKSPMGEDSKNIEMPVLVLHGAADPIVPEEHITEFVDMMNQYKIKDWTLVHFAGAVHSFTNPYAKKKGVAEYDKEVTEQAYAIMDIYLKRWIK